MAMLEDFINKFKEMQIGFAIDETMSGSHVFEPGFGSEGEHPFEFQVTWGPDDILQWGNPNSGTFLSQPLVGKLTAGGLCRDCHCQGTLTLDYFRSHKIIYDFQFSVDGKPYHFIGEKVNIKPWNLAVSHTTCFGTITEMDHGKLVSRSVTHFRFRTTPGFLRSLRFV